MHENASLYTQSFLVCCLFFMLESRIKALVFRLVILIFDALYIFLFMKITDIGLGT